MTVPEGTPQHIRLADEMAQALQIAGSNVGILQMRYGDSEERAIATAWALLQAAHRELDVIRDEIAAQG